MIIKVLPLITVDPLWYSILCEYLRQSGHNILYICYFGGEGDKKSWEIVNDIEDVLIILRSLQKWPDEIHA